MTSRIQSYPLRPKTPSFSLDIRPRSSAVFRSSRSRWQLNPSLINFSFKFSSLICSLYRRLRTYRSRSLGRWFCLSFLRKNWQLLGPCYDGSNLSGFYLYLVFLNLSHYHDIRWERRYLCTELIFFQLPIENNVFKGAFCEGSSGRLVIYYRLEGYSRRCMKWSLKI